MNPAKRTKRFAVVGVAASAGGLEAFRRLLKSLALDTGMAFVLIQHSDPRQPSRLAQSLNTATAMPVIEIEDGMRMVPDHVFVVPPAIDISIHGTAFRTSATPAGRSPMVTIDVLFETLAASLGRMTIGVLLSGAGSDGVEGLRAIQLAGGITFAQDAASAQVASMPARALAAGVADWAMQPEGIAAELTRLAADPYLTSTPPTEPAVNASLPLRQVLVRVHEETGVNLHSYDLATVERRVARRMAVRRTAEMDEYLAFLMTDADETAALLEDVLARATYFFRDPATCSALRQRVFPALLDWRAAGSPIRIWVPECSAGGEVYSVAIALVEYLAEKGRAAPIEIFGSDPSAVAIERARAGAYGDSLLRDVSPERMARFFVLTGGGHRVQKMIRDLCVFAKHDVGHDPPLSKIDLVIYPNMARYFSAALQKRVLRNVHFALTKVGFLVLGGSESGTVASNLFSPFDEASKIFRRAAPPVRARSTGGSLRRDGGRGPSAPVLHEAPGRM
jgi:two-component system, chemotaxis family, CheB/CheR fusion protein